jgi:hypothetical protein
MLVDDGIGLVDGALDVGDGLVLGRIEQGPAGEDALDAVALEGVLEGLEDQLHAREQRVVRSLGMGHRALEVVHDGEQVAEHALAGELGQIRPSPDRATLHVLEIGPLPHPAVLALLRILACGFERRFQRADALFHAFRTASTCLRSGLGNPIFSIRHA